MKYEINDIERLTGIKAHTIRIWEKRYSLVEPHRTDTNIRYYDDEHVKRLMNVATLVNAGKKISKVAQMSAADLENEVYLLQVSTSDATASPALIAQLTTAMISFDRELFGSLIDKVIKRYGLQNGITSIIYPFLENVGVLWSTNEVMPAQEHFASSMIRERLITETAKLPAPWKKGTAMLFLPPNEHHEIGLLLANCITRSAGINTIYLGAAVPFENAVRTFDRLKPTLLVSFFILHKKKMDLPGGFATLAKHIGATPMIVCGRPEMLEQLPHTKNITCCSAVDAFNTCLQQY